MKQHLNKKILSSLIILSISTFSLTGCASLFNNYQSVSELSTTDVLRTFKKGQTTMNEVKKRFGPPTKENIITLAEAKQMFAAKNTESYMGEVLNTFREINKMQEIDKMQNKNTNNTNSKNNINESKKVILWIYDDTKSSSSIFNPLKVKEKGARLLLLFDPQSERLIDYKFQKISKSENNSINPISIF
jgi:hypothetical protein